MDNLQIIPFLLCVFWFTEIVLLGIGLYFYTYQHNKIKLEKYVPPPLTSPQVVEQTSMFQHSETLSHHFYILFSFYGLTKGQKPKAINTGVKKYNSLSSTNRALVSVSILNLLDEVREFKKGDRSDEKGKIALKLKIYNVLATPRLKGGLGLTINKKPSVHKDYLEKLMKKKKLS